VRLADVARLAVLFVVVIDPFAAAIGASTLAGARNDRTRRAIALGGAVVALALLEVVIGLADPLLDALHISDPAAELAAGMVVVVPALDLLWNGPAGRVRAQTGTTWARLALFPYGVPLLAGPGAIAVAIAWSVNEGAGPTFGGAAIALAAITLLVCVWARPPRGRGARVLGALTAVAIALVAFDLIRDGVFGN
jgi:multiple antibiotic resistance protein